MRTGTYTSHMQQPFRLFALFFWKEATLSTRAVLAPHHRGCSGSWKPRRPRRVVACSRLPLIFAIVGCAVRPRNGWLARLSTRSMTCSKVSMFWEDCLDELVLANAASTTSWPTTWFCRSNFCRASVFARVYIITAYPSFMSAAAVSDVLWLVFWQSLRFFFLI